MLELRHVPATVTGCYARPPALDGVAGRATVSVRVAPDELLLLSDTRSTSEIESELRGQDAGSLVIDLSSGYSIWALTGEDRFEAFCRLSRITLPEASGTARGLVGHVPAKVVVRPDALLMIVSSALSHHIHERVLAVSTDLTPSEGAEYRLDAVEAKEGGAS